MKQDFFIFESGKRLDKWLSRATGIARNQIQLFIKEERILVNNLQTKVSYKIRIGDHIELRLPPTSELEAEDIDVEIIYQDEDLIVVNKPAGLVVHPAPGHNDGTLVNALLPLISPDTGDPTRPGIVHRLDKGTSGLLVVARTPQAYDFLVKQFAERTIKREYLALVWGVPNPLEGFIEAPIGRSVRNRKRMGVVENGKYAKTHYRVLAHNQTNPPISLVRCRLETGRTHQIRVHFRWKNNPLLCDPTYGYPKKQRVGSKKLAEITHPLLHAQNLKFIHPTKGELSFSTPPPQDFLDTLSWLSFPFDKHSL
jgi:23S rRNA pseudouridine1911/1915/1917 synthase